MIGPKIGEHDEFEGLYTEKFRSLARPFGEFIKYERDRAAIDVGIHLTEKTNRRFRSVSNTRTWFQLKGIRATTLGLPEFEGRSDVALDLDIDDLRFWYASPEAVYLAVYVESADLFLAEDIRDIVDRQWGEDILNVSTFRAEQNLARVRILKSAVLDDEAWRRMLSHRSLRIDGPTFRGRPLGHRLDSLRSIPNKMEPAVFAQVVNRLLSVHRYEIVEELDPTMIFPQAESQDDLLSLTLGTMNHTYEWVLQLTTEFGFNDGSDFRIEGTPYHVQGTCAVLIHSDKRSYPEMRAVREMANELEDDGSGICWCSLMSMMIPVTLVHFSEPSEKPD